MNFKAWLKQQRSRHDPVGDLARDAFATGECNCYRHFKTAAGLRRHMRASHNASDDALSALERSRIEYEGVIA